MTVAFGEPESVEDVILSGHVMIGGSVSAWILSILAISSKHVNHSQIYSMLMHSINTRNRLPLGAMRRSGMFQSSKIIKGTG